MAIKGTIYIKKDTKTVDNVSAPAKEEIKKLDVLTTETESVIYQVASVFPFQLFPDKIIVDKNKVTIVRKQLLYKRIFPILLEDIRTVKVTRGPFFASIEFEVSGYE